MTTSAINTTNTYRTDPQYAYSTTKRIIEATVLKEGGKLPTRAHRTDAGADLYSCEDVTILPGDAYLVNTGIGVKIPEGYGGFVLNRSSQRIIGITSLGTGLIDSDYRGPIKVLIVNEGNTEYKIKSGETKIGQLVIIPVVLVDFVDYWNDTERGTGGFGSTG